MEEQKALYPNPTTMPKNSPHLNWEGADVRSTDFTEREIEKMVTFLNLFSYVGGQRPVAIYHNVGNGVHLHLQYGVGKK